MVEKGLDILKDCLHRERCPREYICGQALYIGETSWGVVCHMLYIYSE
jgi:hypothetical protein